MKLITVIMCGLLFGAAAAYACTDSSPKKAVRSADDASIVYEYFRPAKLQEKKKAARTLAELADSILTNARMKYEAEEAGNNATSNSARISAETKGTPKAHQERAEVELYRIKSWADSICNAFRRGYYKIGPEDAPR